MTQNLLKCGSLKFFKKLQKKIIFNFECIKVGYLKIFFFLLILFFNPLYIIFGQYHSNWYYILTRIKNLKYSRTNSSTFTITVSRDGKWNGKITKLWCGPRSNFTKKLALLRMTLIFLLTLNSKCPKIYFNKYPK
jgi:hypothetical protein